MRGSGLPDVLRRGTAGALAEGPGKLAVAVLSPVLAMLLALTLPGQSGAALWPGTQSFNDGSASDAPRDRLNTAADLFAGVADGAGLTFDVVQRSVLHAKPGGPQIEIPHPTDRYRSLGYTDRLYIGGLVANGTVSGDGFYLVMRAGPPTEEAAADLGGELQLAALTRGERTWRNDGEGWYETGAPPGIGLDTQTVALLPRLLRQATAPTEAGSKVVDGRQAEVIRAEGRVANAPGLLAIDGAAFTELREPLALALDGEGRLVELTAVMRNTNLDLYDLIVTTTVSFHYGEVPPLPQPLPAAPPFATPAPEVDR